MRYAYQLHYHLGFQTLRGKPVLGQGSRAGRLEGILATVCQRCGYRVLEQEVEPSWVRLLLSLTPAQSPAQVVRSIKANASRSMFEACAELAPELGRRRLWSRAYYLRSVGDVPSSSILQYIANQKRHHEAFRGKSAYLAGYAHPNPSHLLNLRPFSHCVAEYNCHLVFCPVAHVGAIDAKFAKPLLDYMLAVADARGFDVIRLSILTDHVHLFAALRPHQAPESVALTIMNNTSYWFRKHNPGVFKVWGIPGFWAPSAFIRTAGAATTSQVRNYLKRVGHGG